MFNLNKYIHLEMKEGVCGGRPVIKETRIEPRHLIGLRLVDIMEDFRHLKIEAIIEVYSFLKEYNKEYQEYLNELE